MIMTPSLLYAPALTFCIPFSQWKRVEKIDSQKFALTDVNRLFEIRQNVEMRCEIQNLPFHLICFYGEQQVNRC